MKEKLWNAKYCYMVLVNTLICFGFYMITTILTVYLLEVNVDISKAGVVVGLFSITALVMRPVSGYITDSYNQKMLMIFSTVLVAVSVLGYVLTSSLPVIVGFRILHGLAFAVGSTAIVAMASHYIPQSRFNEGVGYLGLGQIIASAVAPGLGVYVTSHFGVRYAFYIAAALSLLAMIVMALFPFQHEPVPKEQRATVSVRNMISVKVLDYSFISGCYSFLNGVVSSFLILFAAQRGLEDVGIYFTVSAVFLFLARPLSGKIADRFGLKYIVYPAICMTILSILILVNMNSMWMLILSAAIRALAQGAIQPSLQAACIQKVGVEKSGAATGTYYLGADIGQGAGPVIGGVIAGIWGYAEVFYFCIVMVMVAALVFFLSSFRKKS